MNDKASDQGEYERELAWSRAVSFHQRVTIVAFLGGSSRTKRVRGQDKNTDRVPFPFLSTSITFSLSQALNTSRTISDHAAEGNHGRDRDRRVRQTQANRRCRKAYTSVTVASHIS